MENNFYTTRLAVFRNCSEVQKYHYAHVGNLLEISEKLDKYHIDKNLYDKMEDTIGDIILGFYKIEDTVPLLQQELGIDPRTAALLGADVLEFLAPLSDPTWQPPVEEETLPVPEQSPVSVAPAVVSIPNEPEPLRTMRSDMDEVREHIPSYQPTAAPEPVHQSSQPSLSSVPSYTTPGSIPPSLGTKPVDSRPKWSSEL